MEIVKARYEHLDKIMEIERASFTDPWSRGGVEVYLHDPFGEILTALEGETVAGFAIYHVSFEESELFSIAVREDLRGRGIGARLLRAVLDRARARGAEKMFLEVRKSNEAARRLYRSAGFQICGERRDYYALPREDAILMDRELLEREYEHISH